MQKTVSRNKGARHIRNSFESIYKKVNAITSNRRAVPVFPLLVDMEITSACNLKCIMCEHTYMERKQEMMGEAVFKRIVDECRPHEVGIRFILFSEPFLHPKIIEYSRYVKEVGLPLHITTNGTLIEEEHIDELICIGLDSITFSMQGATEEEYAFMRKTDKLPIITEKIKYLAKKRKTKPFIQISTTVSRRDSKKDIEGFRRKWGVYADLVTVGVTSWTRIAQRNPKIYGILGFKQNTKREYLPCQDIMTKLGVLANGDITVCCNDSEGRLVIGNVLKNSLSQIWDSEVHTGLRLLLKNMRMDMFEPCRTCEKAYNFLQRDFKDNDKSFSRARD